MNKVFAAVLTFGSLATLLGCGGNVGSRAAAARGEGALTVIANFGLQTRSAPGYVDTVSVTVTPPEGVILPSSFPNPFLLTRDSQRLKIDGLRASDEAYRLSMEALTDGAVVGTAQKEVVVATDATQQIDVSTDLSDLIARIVIGGGNAINLGRGVVFLAQAQNSNDEALFPGGGFVWTSTDPSIVSIDRETGMATANALGSTFVTVNLVGTAHSRTFEVFVIEF